MICYTFKRLVLPSSGKQNTKDGYIKGYIFVKYQNKSTDIKCTDYGSPKWHSLIKLFSLSSDISQTILSLWLNLEKHKQVQSFLRPCCTARKTKENADIKHNYSSRILQIIFGASDIKFRLGGGERKDNCNLRLG
jgi:hypothetical protein